MWHIFIHLSLEEHLGCSSVLAIVNSAAVNMGVLIPLRCPVFISLGCILNFPDSSAFKESACSAGDPGSIPRWGRSTGEETGYRLSFPCGSAGKESTCKAGHPGSIPESGRSAGEGIGYPLQYSWAFLVAQLVKNPPAMGETWVGKIP